MLRSVVLTRSGVAVLSDCKSTSTVTFVRGCCLRSFRFDSEGWLGLVGSIALPPIQSGALLRGDGGKRGPALLDVLAAAVRTGDLFLLMPSNGQSLQKGFLARVTEELVV